MPKKSRIVPLVLSMVLVIALAFFFLNRTLIIDHVKGYSYAPSTEMAEIRDSLRLTREGTRIFNATHPVLDSRDSFNSDCESNNPDLAVYGCYNFDKIYIYNINSPELPGFRESTTAHELLHAVWARLPVTEKNRLVPILEEVYEDNKSLLEETLKVYQDSERIDELYVRSAVQIKNLPAELESHYAKIFTDQDKIVDFYNSYITPFKELSDKIDSLGAELKTMHAKIEQIAVDYKNRSETFNKEVDDFNNCSRTAGCFSSDYQFSTRRAELVEIASDLDALYSELNSEIDSYNEKVEEYNSNILHKNTLSSLVNSNSKVENVE